MAGRPFADTTCGPDELAKNTAVRKALKGFGDDGTKERHVIHFFHPGNARTVDPSGMLTSLQIYGYALKVASDGGIIAEEHREVASADFDRTTQGLQNVARKLNWTYDGWECEVNA